MKCNSEHKTSHVDDIKRFKTAKNYFCKILSLLENVVFLILVIATDSFRTSPNRADSASP